ncbi:MAG: hypothetical protein OIF51_15965 [Cellvibrionaceae bacterium]|nr:hypothetical protein [Cellvibrionaceae bacterium]
MYKKILVLYFLFVASLSSADEILDALNEMDNLIMETGDPKVFAESIVEEIKRDNCRNLVPLIHKQSKYFSDTEYFYAKCVYQSRQLGKIISAEYGPIGFSPAGLNDKPPLLPSQKVYVEIELNGKAHERGIFIKFLPFNGKFAIVDIDFIFGRAR